MPTCEKEFTLAVVANAPVPQAWWKNEEADFDDRIDAILGLALTSGLPAQILQATGIIDFGTFLNGNNANSITMNMTPDAGLLPAVNKDWSVTGWFKWTAAVPSIFQVRLFNRIFFDGGSNELNAMRVRFLSNVMSVVVSQTAGGVNVTETMAFVPVSEQWYFFYAHYSGTTQKHYIQVREPATTFRSIGAVSQSLAVVTAANGTFSVADIGSLIKLSTADWFYEIIGVTDSENATVDTSANIPTDTAGIYTDMTVFRSIQAVSYPTTPDLGSLSYSDQPGPVGEGVTFDEQGLYAANLSDAQVNFIWNNHAGRTYPF